MMIPRRKSDEAGAIAQQNALEVSHVSKRFRSHRQGSGYSTLKSLFLGRGRGKKQQESAQSWHQALTDVSLVVPKGEVRGVIGRNGSGKTTLLKLITGIYRPDEGTIQCEGRLASLIELGAGFHPDFTGRENALINGMVLGMSKREILDKMDTIIAYAEIEEFIDEPVRTYSTGMYMRLAFAIAVHVEPDVLLLDEILSVGDEQFARKCAHEIERFRANGTTILIVSHDLEAVKRYCSHVIHLDGGHVRNEGPAAEVVDAYRAQFAE